MPLKEATKMFPFLSPPTFRVIQLAISEVIEMPGKRKISVLENHHMRMRFYSSNHCVSCNNFLNNEYYSRNTFFADQH